MFRDHTPYCKGGIGITDYKTQLPFIFSFVFMSTVVMMVCFGSGQLKCITALLFSGDNPDVVNSSCVSIFAGGNSERHKYAMLQYMYSGPEIDIQIKPHGNSKSSKPFFRTSSTTQMKIKEVASTHKPKKALAMLTKEQGGEIMASGASVLPRDRRQISYSRQKTNAKDVDPLFSIMLECKLAQGSNLVYVQDVKAAPFPMCVLSYEWQLQDLVRFAANNQKFCIMTVDTTYNLGQFYVTPITYHHLMLKNVKTGKHPIILGPILIHQKVDFAAFNYFASTLIGCKRELAKVMAFGTDGDKALIEAFVHNFPYAIQLRCFIHFKRNVEEKLKSFGIPSKEADEFIADIFGKRVGNTFQTGLVESISTEEFDEKLLLLKDTWSAREHPYAPSSGPRFNHYFHSIKLML